MERYVLLRRREQLPYPRLSQPHRPVSGPKLDVRESVLGVVEDDFPLAHPSPSVRRKTHGTKQEHLHIALQRSSVKR